MRRRLAPILEARRSPVRGILRALGEIAIMTIVTSSIIGLANLMIMRRRFAAH